MELKVLNDGLDYARIQSKDGKKAISIYVDHARKKEGLCDHPLPKIQKEFKKTRFSQDFLGVPS